MSSEDQKLGVSKRKKIKEEKRKEILKSLKNEGDFNTMFNCYKMIKLNSEI